MGVNSTMYFVCSLFTSLKSERLANRVASHVASTATGVRNARLTRVTLLEAEIVT